MSDELEAFQASIRSNPNEFIQDWLRFDSWEKQREIVDAVFKHSRVAVASCTSSGKTAIAARIALAFLVAYPYSTVLTTAPSWEQVKVNLWKEIHVAYQESKFPLGGELNVASLSFNKDWYAAGFSTNDASNVLGRHADHVLVILDDAPGIEQPIFDAVQNALAGGGKMTVLMLGNPFVSSGEFHNAFHAGAAQWHKIHMSAEDTPNFKAGKVVKSGLITRQWVEDRRARWGEASSLFRAFVLGQFPTQGTDTLIPLDWVLAAQKRWKERREPVAGDRTIGVDVARFGSDDSVISERVGVRLERMENQHGHDTMQTSGRAIFAYNRGGAGEINVDVIGMGSGVADRIREQQYPINDCNVAESAEHPDCDILRDELWWMMRIMLDPNNGCLLELPPDEEMTAELTCATYKTNSAGKVKVMSKDEMKKILGRSPDRADSVMLAFWRSEVYNGLMWKGYTPEVTVL
jgi:hypothetical protein